MRNIKTIAITIVVFLSLMLYPASLSFAYEIYPPVIEDQTFTVPLGATFTAQLTATDLDEGYPIVYYGQLLIAPTIASALVHTDGLLSATPYKVGSISFPVYVGIRPGQNYREDPHVTTITITLNVIDPLANNTPTTQDLNLDAQQGSEISGQIIAADLDNDTLLFSMSQQALFGLATLNSATGEFSYIFSDASATEDSFIVAVNDGKGGEVLSTVFHQLYQLLSLRSLKMYHRLRTRTYQFHLQLISYLLFLHLQQTQSL